MGWMILAGAALTLIGVIGLLWCVIAALRARRASLPEEQMRAKLQGLVAINFAALGISAIGLGLVVVGILLG